MTQKAKRRKVSRVCQDLGSQVRSFRERKGWSQEELAHRARMHVTYLSSLERGHRNPTLNVIADLARALDVPLPVLFKNVPTDESH
jgi:transcriptional regulator with XRE-family HTH domain